MAVPGFVNNLLVSGVIDGVIHLTSAMENDTGSSKEEDISASIWEIMIQINIKFLVCNSEKCFGTGTAIMSYLFKPYGIGVKYYNKKHFCKDII